MKDYPIIQNILKVVFILFLLTASTALMAQGTPTATTDGASAITAYEATLNGTVNANGSSTTVTFEYGINTNYGRTITADQSPISGSTNTAVSKIIEELIPNTTYHYRVVAVNGNGTAYGDDMTFTTTAIAPVVTTNDADGISSTSATLNGLVNANNTSTTVTFQYGLTTAYGSTVTADQSPVTGMVETAISKTISGLTTATTYHYRAVGVNTGGTTYGEDKTFRTGTPPTAVTNAASAINISGATLNGTVNANGSSTTVTFELGINTSYGSTVTAIQSPVTGSSNTAVSYVKTGLIPNRTYHYRVVAQNVISTIYGSDMTFTTQAAAPTATTIAASDITTTTATLNGTVNAQNDSTTVTFQYGLTTAYGTTVTADQSPVNGVNNTAVSRAIGGLTDATTYHYRVVAQNGTGTTYGLDKTFHTGGSAPTATTVAATAISPTGATLNGTVNANNNETTIIFEYGLTTTYRDAVTATQSPLSTGIDTAVSAALTGLTNNTLYHYRVVAQNTLGTVYGVDLTFRTLIPATAVTNAATAIGPNGATLNGTVNANGVSTTVTFQIGLTTGYGTTFTAPQSPVSGSANTAVNYTVGSLTPNSTYHYRVVAQTFYGTIYGADRTFTTNAIAPTVTTVAATGITYTGGTLNGTVNANNASTTVTFEYGLNTGYGTTVTADQSPVNGVTNTAVSKAITGLTESTTYHYRVVGQNIGGTTNGTDMTFTTLTTTLPIVTTAQISTVTTNSAKSGGNVTADGGEVVTARGVCWATSHNPAISGSHTTNGSGTGLFTSAITGLTDNTVYYVRAYATNNRGTAYGQEVPLKTNSESVSVDITSPVQGATVSGTITIAATATAADTVQPRMVAAVKFYINNILIAEDLSAPYETQWDSHTITDGLCTLKAVAYNQSNESSQDIITFIVRNERSSIGVNRTRLDFGSNGLVCTGAQTLWIENTGTDALNWNISDNVSWLTCTPGSGINAGIVSVAVDPIGLAVGTYTANITITAPQSENGTLIVPVTFVIYAPDATNVPFGVFATPLDGSTVMSSIPVTGWVLDDIETTGVKIYREPVAGEGSENVYIGDAVFVEGARPDVETSYPDTPLNYRAGWGYMLLTNFLPDGGNGSFTLYAIATDKEGNQVTLGSKTIICDNAHAVKPFGAIDTPAQGGTASGAAYVNFGWALTPLPNTIPTDGSTITLWVDGVPLSGHPVYNQYRSDIANLFPGYNNSNGAVGYYYLNTTPYANGVHTIAWSVSDSGGNSDGIGSRYFTILNLTNADAPKSTRHIPGNTGFIDSLPELEQQAITIKELEQVEIPLGQNNATIQGYLKMEDRFISLPVGSTLDQQSGTFYWSAGVGFTGEYPLVFVIQGVSGQYYKKTVVITIEPKFNIKNEFNE